MGGEAETDRYGDQVYGERAWFALDNRRLHVLQSFATQMWPKRCSIIVRCLEEVPGTTVRELRKFRTTTEGRSVEVGARGGSSGRWRWQDALPRGASCENVANEGVFSELLSAPEDGWQYIDHSGKVQGPFCREKMRLWNE